MPRSINPFVRRKSAPASPFASAPRRKPGVSRQTSEAEKADDGEVPRLDDLGQLPALVPSGISQDVISLMRYVQEHIWDEIPAVAGMNSEKISAVLRFRETLPPIVSTAHLYALSVSSTDTERELARLLAAGRVRKVIIPGRGKGGAAIGDGVVHAEDWKKMVQNTVGLTDEIKEKYLHLLNSTSGSVTTTPTTSLSQPEVQQLVSAGFFTNPSAFGHASTLFAAPGSSSLTPLSASGFTAPTGTLAAVGGQGAIHESGGGGSALATHNNPSAHHHLYAGRPMTFSLPGTGAYLKLLTAARTHLLHTLKQLSPRYKEATQDALKEKWEGNVLGDAASRAKRARGEWSGVLPGKTKKWREFYGLRFEWVLAEAMGAGIVECFETGIGVVGVRAR